MKIVAKNNLDIQDDISRLLFQTKALVMTLSADQQFEVLNSETLSNAFWLLDDRLSDLEQACEKLFDGEA